jgi:ATP-dependent DNA helicase Rep/DNA helicase-2/ATP-dependent DNA helicase PcrA
LSWVRNRRAWEGKPSRFLADIPRPLMARHSAAQSPRQASAGPVAQQVQSPPQAEVDRLVAEFMARKAAKASR